MTSSALDAAAEKERLTERVRALLADEPTTREVAMFGGVSFMVEDRMVVAAQGGGHLLVRVDPARNHELVGRPGAVQAEMGAGRSMGDGWISVSRGAITTDDELSSWIDVALGYRAPARRRRG